MFKFLMQKGIQIGKLFIPGFVVRWDTFNKRAAIPYQINRMPIGLVSKYKRFLHHPQIGNADAMAMLVLLVVFVVVVLVATVALPNRLESS